jgi:hypothetical protein
MRQLLFWKGIKIERESALWLLSRFAFISDDEMGVFEGDRKSCQEGKCSEFRVSDCFGYR